jgi:hypothetical protein
MTEPAKQFDGALGRYEAAVEEVIAICDGDAAGAIQALLIANEFLEQELERVLQSVASGYDRQRVRKGLRSRQAKLGTNFAD